MLCFPLFSVPPESLTIEGPEELTLDFDARFTCKASASNLPSKLAFKLTSHHSNLLDELVKEDLVQIEDSVEKWLEHPEAGVSGWASSRSLVIKRDVLKQANKLGDHMSFECQVPDPYHERRILVSASKFIALESKY